MRADVGRGDRAAPLALVCLLLCGCREPVTAAPSPRVPRPSESAPSPSPSARTVPAPAAIASALTQTADDSIDALDRIDDERAWRRLAAPSDEHAIARTEVVKFVFDRGRDELHFCQSVRWPLHYDYVLHVHPEERVRYPAMRDFMTRNYLRADRAYVMGSIVRFLDADLWALELGPADTLGAPAIAALLGRVEARTFFGARLRFHPRSEQQLRMAARAALPTVDTDTLWQGVRYQPVTLGGIVGRVRIVRGALDEATIRGDEILVVEETPDELPPVRALVTAELQTPLAHVAVLSESRGTPNMALRGVVDDRDWLAFEGRTARLVVGARAFSLSAASEEDASQDSTSRVLPAADGDALALTMLDALSLDDIARVGTKSAQLAEVRRLGLPTADGFVVPVGRYLAHLRAHQIDVRAATLRETSGFATDRAIRARTLAALRVRIAEAELDAALLEELVTHVARLAPERRAHADGPRPARVILRSSTNAEDLPGWSGAGLYDSLPAVASDRAALSRAVRAVWASTYTLRAFDERELAGVDHDAVAMAVLVQPFLDDVRAMGVVITENPYSQRRQGYLVDLEPRGTSVTATVDARPEEWLLYLHTSPELVSRSSRLRGETLLDGRDALLLRDQLTRLHEGMLARWRARNPAVRMGSVDAEIALDARGRAVFLQARPYLRRR